MTQPKATTFAQDGFDVDEFYGRKKKTTNQPSIYDQQYA
jgi:hypothetical protein